MSEIWIETPKGYFYPRNDKLSSAILAKLQMLSLDGLAENKGYGFFVTFEKSVLLSDEDAELLKFPPRNPYRLSIRTLGILGKSDFRYILEVLRPNGQFFVSPKFNGALLHVDSTTIYRLNADQYELVRLTEDSNENISKLNDRQEAMTRSLTNAYKIQQHSLMTNAKLDNFLDTENLKIVVPDSLDIEFEEIRDGKFQVQPILLVKGVDGKFYKSSVEEFKDTFNRRHDVSDVYIGRDRKRYICSEDVKKGLAQIKSVPKMDKADKERYSKQPKELFNEEIFNFDSQQETDVQSESEFYEGQDWLYNEGELSDRVIGVEEMAQDKTFEPNAYKVNWLKTDLEDQQDNQEDFEIEETENFPENNFEDEVEKRNKNYAIKIKPNFERIDYSRKNLRRIETESEFKNALLPNVKLLPHQIIGVKKMFNLWQGGATGILIADDMGLGKTLQTLAFIAGLKKCCTKYPKIENPILIVAPTALLTNWKAEYEKFIQKDIFQFVVELHGNELKNYLTDDLTPNKKRKLKLSLPKNTLALTTYETLRDYQFSFAEVDWCCIIADEAQKIKNPTTGITTALKAMKYDYSISLSGTPVENSWVDLWSIMDFVQPAWLGDLRNFKETYLQPLKNDSSPANIEFVGKKLKNSLGDLFIRRMKHDHLSGLPKKNVFPCMEEMPEYQKSCYIAVLIAVLLNIDKVTTMRKPTATI
jgi:SNF2 family DNA or RNA helicase